MYDIRIVYQDYRNYDVEIDDENLDGLMKAISKGDVYYDKAKTVGFWIPSQNLRCVYLQKKSTSESQACQKSPPLEAENASPV